MTFTRRPLLVMAAAMMLGSGSSSAAVPPAFLGDWFATLDAGSVQLRLRMAIAEGPRATLYSIDQGNSEIPSGETKIDGDKLFVTWPVIGASFEGRLANGEIDGQFKQGATLPLKFARAQKKAEPAVPLTAAGLAALRANSGAPAMAAAALNRNGRRIAFADGIRAIGHPQTVTTSDRWHVGSNTKSMTATLVARAVEAGLIKWTDTVGGTLGNTVPGIRPEYAGVTYVHLLSHRAGLAANIDIAELIKYPRESADARADRIAYARNVLTRTPAGPKEKHFEYSNSGYVVAGAMLEAQLGAPWEDLMRRHVFTPLKMTSAGFGAPGTPNAFDQPAGHNLGATGTLAPFPPGGPITDNPAVIGPAGRVHASLDDLLIYLAAHAGHAPFLSAASWQKLHTPPFGGAYALGWERRGNKIWHNGSNTLWYAEMQADLDRGIIATAATNDGRLATVTAPIGKALAGAAEAVA